MSTVPKNLGDKIAFFRAHIGGWIDHAPQIGADPALLAELASQIETAQAAFEAQIAAYSRARAATQRLQSEVDRLARLGGNVIAQVRSRARTAGDEVYHLAKIPAPAQRSKRGAPGQPFNFTVELQPVGYLTLTWKCRHPRGTEGTIYRVSRRDTDHGPFRFLDTVGVKRFVDTSIPPGTASVTYQVQAVRSTTVGPLARYLVYLSSIDFPPVRVTTANIAA